MADFRRLLYAFALVALLASFAVPASAISLMECRGNAPSKWIRGEGYTELTSDIIITCTGGEHITEGSIPTVDVSVTVTNTTFTSKITDKAGSVVFTEAMLIFDEAGNPSVTGSPSMNPCGSNDAEYNEEENAAPYTCEMFGTFDPEDTYNGSSNRPNVFQGRQLNVSNGTTIVFTGVPLDAGPLNGGIPTRYMRITNLRVNAAALGITGPSAITQPIVMTVNFGGSVAGQQDIIVTTATVRGALKVEQGDYDGSANFLQCEAESGTINQSIKVSETFFTFFKARSVDQLDENGSESGDDYSEGNTYWVDPDSDGFQYPQRATENGLVGDSEGEGFQNSTGNIAAAGRAQQGTRIAVKFSNIPKGSNPSVPNVVYLKSGNVITGVMVLVKETDSAGAGGEVQSGDDTEDYTDLSDLEDDMAVYEVLYANPDALETATIVLRVDPDIDLAASPSEPEVGVTATARAGFAPFYSATTGAGKAWPMSAQFESGDDDAESDIDQLDHFPIPRFINVDEGPVELYSFDKCACNLLFPWVVGDSTFTTSIVVANTSKDPGSSNGFSAAAQSGVVKFWYYGTQGISLDPTTPISTQASQTSSALVPVPAGSYLAHIVSPSNAGNTPANGLVKLTANFAGYVIAQAQFQYCHGIASISANVPGFGTQTYLGLTLDVSDDHDNLPRTTQKVNDGLVH